MIGRRIGNHFVIGEIGFEGMGAGYKAEDRRSGRTVALKILKEPLYESSAVKRFLRELEKRRSSNGRTRGICSRIYSSSSR